MGESVRILDLARQMIRLSGLEVKDEDNPDGDIEIKITGLRPGEKLFEELLIGDNVTKTSHSRIMTAQEVHLSWSELKVLLERLDQACREADQLMAREILLKAPTAFTPSDEICDLVWLQQQGQVGQAKA